MPARAVDGSGAPAFGAFSEPLDDAGSRDLAGPWRRGRLYRLTHGKSWRWGMVADGRTLAAFALVDVGYASSAFAMVVDLDGGRPIADASALGLAGGARVGDRPNDGTTASFSGGGMRIRIDRPRGAATYRASVRAKGLEIDAELDARDAPAPRTVIAPVPGGTLNVTQKSACLPSRASIRAGDERREITAGLGGFDFTSGLLARRTTWRWAFATGRAGTAVVGLNLVSGFNDTGDASENAVWREGAVLPAGRARFVFDPAHPMEPWRVVTDDGAVDLVFRRAHAHREDRDLVVARSRFVQAAGTFEGSVAGVRVAGLPGVTEDQDVLW